MPGRTEERKNRKGNAYLAGYFVFSLKTVCNQVSGVLAKFGVSPVACQPGVAYRRATSSPRAEVLVKARQPDSAARPAGQAPA
jgi:hypothetical protein